MERDRNWNQESLGNGRYRQTFGVKALNYQEAY